MGSRYGVREICDVVLRAKTKLTLGSKTFYKDEPVLYFDTLKTSNLEGSATTVYATGGRGNPRLVAWDGERVLTFTMEDALISSESFSILSGAGLLEASESKPVYQHMTSRIQVTNDNSTFELPEEACWDGYDKDDPYYKKAAGIYIMTLTDGNIDSEPCVPFSVGKDHKTITCYTHAGKIDRDEVVLVDYYVKRTSGTQVIQITADKFGGSFYLEGSTLFRREGDNYDMPAEIVIPNCKIQSNFTFNMANSGDPSTFSFVMDVFPDYTKFDETRKVMAELQIVDDSIDGEEETRDKCTPADIIGKQENETLERPVTITYDNNSNSMNTRITISGNNIKPFTTDELKEVAYERTDGDPFLPEGFKMITVEIDVPVERDKEYILVTRNPIHKYYKGEEGIINDGTGFHKEQTVKVTDADVKTITTGLSELPGKVSFELYTKDEEGNKADLVKTITITNKVKFA